MDQWADSSEGNFYFKALKQEAADLKCNMAENFHKFKIKESNANEKSVWQCSN